MGCYHLPELSCTLCTKPVDLRFDLCTDENGRSVHEECYVNRLLAEHANQGADEKLFDIRIVQSPARRRPEMTVATLAL